MLFCAQDAAYKHYSIHYLLYVYFSFAATLLSWTEDKLLKVIMIHGKLSQWKSKIAILIFIVHVLSILRNILGTTIGIMI